MKTFTTRLYLWLHGLLGEFIAGVADAFLIVGGGAAAAQVTDSASAPVAGKAMLAGLAIAGLRRSAMYLKANPLPPLTESPK